MHPIRLSSCRSPYARPPREPEEARAPAVLISTLDRDPEAGYFGAELHERTLLSGDGARVGEIRFRDGLAQPAKA